MLIFTTLAVVFAAACGKNEADGENPSAGAVHNASVCNIDTDRLPYNEESIYQQLFDINNKIDVELDVSEETFRQLQKDYEEYEKKGSKSPVYREADLKVTITTEKDSITYAIDHVGIRMKGIPPALIFTVIMTVSII